MDEAFESGGIRGFIHRPHGRLETDHPDLQRFGSALARAADKQGRRLVPDTTRLADEAPAPVEHKSAKEGRS